MQTLSFESKFGAVQILMRVDRAPKTCRYFSDLIKNGAYAKASIFRIVTTSGIQASADSEIDVLQAGPAQQFSGPRHITEHESTATTGLRHRKWTVSAARFDLGELYGSFFICLRDEPTLDFGGSRQPDGQGFAAFGEVIEGFENLEKIFMQAEASDLLRKEIPISDVEINYNNESER